MKAPGEAPGRARTLPTEIPDDCGALCTRCWRAETPWQGETQAAQSFAVGPAASSRTSLSIKGAKNDLQKSFGELSTSKTDCPFQQDCANKTHEIATPANGPIAICDARCPSSAGHQRRRCWVYRNARAQAFAVAHAGAHKEYAIARSHKRVCVPGTAKSGAWGMAVLLPAPADARRSRRRRLETGRRQQRSSKRESSKAQHPGMLQRSSEQACGSGGMLQCWGRQRMPEEAGFSQSWLAAASGRLEHWSMALQPPASFVSNFTALLTNLTAVHGPRCDMAGLGRWWRAGALD